MDDDLNFFKNGRQPQIFENWKTTSNFSKLEDDLIHFGKSKKTLIQGKWKTNYFFGEKSDELVMIFFEIHLILNIKYIQNEGLTRNS
jgi:hypothetical protein